MSQNSSELKQQIEMVCIERGLDVDEVVESIEAAISGAYRKEFGDKEKGYEAKFDLEKGTYKIDEVIEVVDEVVFPEKELSVVEARLTNPNAEVGDVLRTPISEDQKVAFGRIASQVAKQVLIQAINGKKHTKVLQKFKDKVGDVVTVEVDHFKRGGYSVKLSQTQSYIPRENLLPIDKFKPGQLIKALIVEIIDDKRGSKIILSRTHSDFVKSIIAKEVPEVETGIVNIKKIVREPGFRTKVIVAVNEDEDQTIDPVGTILGRRNVRIINIKREISSTMQEQLDVIEYQKNNLESMIADSLEPAEIEKVEIDQENKTATVFCYPEEASLAVGRRGVNIRLAGELLGLDIRVETFENDGFDENDESEDDGESFVVSAE